MKIFIIISAIILIAFILKAFVSGNTLLRDTSRPPENMRPQDLKENDKLIVVTNVRQEDIRSALKKFCNMYNEGSYKSVLRLSQIDSGTFAITFPYDIDFVSFCFAVNFLKYPTDIKWDARVRAWAITKQGDEWITEKSINKKVMLYLAQDDKEYDNVFLTTQDNVGYKLGFAAGEERQLLSVPQERYVNQPVDYLSIQTLKHEDFK